MPDADPVTPTPAPPGARFARSLGASCLLHAVAFACAIALAGHAPPVRGGARRSGAEILFAAGTTARPTVFRVAPREAELALDDPLELATEPDADELLASALDVLTRDDAFGVAPIAHLAPAFESRPALRTEFVHAARHLHDEAGDFPDAVELADLRPESGPLPAPAEARGETLPVGPVDDAGERVPDTADGGEAPGPEEGTADPLLLAGDPPSYPRQAVRMGWQGVVVCRISVERDGSVSAVRVEESSGHRVLDDAALEAVRGWRFRPAVAAGAPVRRDVLHAVRFELL